MPNPYFRFKQFTVWHDQCAMKVNTDGVLLGAWADAGKPHKILDIGTGTGIIALMLAQRFPFASVHGIEIEENAYRQAISNVEKSDWKSRIEIFHYDFGKYYLNCEQQYDMIVTNPPYFSNSLRSSTSEKITARHNDALPFEVLLEGVSRLLNANGTFSVILPAENSDFINEAFIYGLKCQRCQLVRSSTEKKVLRQLLEFGKNYAGPCKTNELIIHQQPGEYSQHYKELTKDFYLNF